MKIVNDSMKLRLDVCCGILILVLLAELGGGATASDNTSPRNSLAANTTLQGTNILPQSISNVPVTLLPPRRARLPATAATNRASAAPQRVATPPIPSNRVPASVLKKYDVNKNGVLDPGEWERYKSDLERRMVLIEVIAPATNSVGPASGVPTSKTEKP